MLSSAAIFQDRCSRGESNVMREETGPIISESRQRSGESGLAARDGRRDTHPEERHADGDVCKVSPA